MASTMTWPLPHQPGFRMAMDQLVPEPTTLCELKVAMNNKFKKKTIEVNMDVYTTKQSNGDTVDQFLRGLEAQTYKC